MPKISSSNQNSKSTTNLKSSSNLESESNSTKASSPKSQKSQIQKKGKSDEELIILRYYFLKSKHSEKKEKFDLAKICRETGFSKRQVYKWMWDERKREKKSDDLDLEIELWEMHQIKYKKIKKLKKKKGCFALRKIHAGNDLRRRVPKRVWKGIEKSLISLIIG